MRLRGTFEALLDVVPSLTNVGLVAARRVPRRSSGDLTVGELSSFVYLFTLLVFPLRLIGYALSELPHSLAGWRRVREVLDEPIEPDPLASIAVADPAARACSSSTLGFTFPGESRPALDDVSLDVAAGRIVAVVGPTGVGQDARWSRSSAGWSRRPPATSPSAPGERAVVFQEAFLFSGTIRHNLVLGDADRRRRAVGGAAPRPRRRLRRRDRRTGSTRSSASAASA